VPRSLAHRCLRWPGPSAPRAVIALRLPCGSACYGAVAITLGFMSAGPSLSLAEWTVLALISEAPTHGFAICRITAPDRQLGRIWHIPQPTIYRAIGLLREAWLIAPQTLEPESGPQRTIYSATPAGHEAAAAWLDTPVEHVRDVRSHLLIKLALLDRGGTDATGLLQRQKAILEPIAAATLAWPGARLCALEMCQVSRPGCPAGGEARR
jgi:DNA-binding PadR family transcriptional regulator